MEKLIYLNQITIMEALLEKAVTVQVINHLVNQIRLTKQALENLK